MNREEKMLANQAIEENVSHTTARKIVRWVMECELNGFDTIRPTNQYLAKKFNWSLDTTKVAISKAKKSGFIATTGTSRNRTFELNVQFLKGKMAEIVAKKPPKKNLDFSDIMLLSEGDANLLADQSANLLANQVANQSANQMANLLANQSANQNPQNNRGKSRSNNNKKNSVSVNSKKSARTLDDSKLLKKITVFQSLWSLSLGVAPTILAQLSVALPPQKLKRYLDFVLDEKNADTIALAMNAAEREHRNLDFFLTDNIGRIRNLI